MRTRVLYALLAACVPAAAAGAASLATVKLLPKAQRRAVERYLLAPGRSLADTLQESRALRRGQELLAERIERPRERLEKIAEGAEAKLKLERLPHLYNVGLWGGAAFLLCLLMTLVFSVASIKDAVSLGVKVSLTLAFLQAALILGGLLALQKLG